jgi:hypothetical protein
MVLIKSIVTTLLLYRLNLSLAIYTPFVVHFYVFGLFLKRLIIFYGYGCIGVLISLGSFRLG